MNVPSLRCFASLAAAIAALVWAPLPASAEVASEPRDAGEVISADGDAYVVALRGEAGVNVGSVLQAYRRMPAARGTAEYRDHAVWWEVGSLRVRALNDGLAVAVANAGPEHPLPAGLNESGAPPEQIHVGDRVRVTGAIAARPEPVRVAFDRSLIFGEGAIRLKGEGKAFLAEWLRGLRSMEGPIEVQVHAHIDELGGVEPDVRREISAAADAPVGPLPGSPVTPVDALYPTAHGAYEVPSAREVHVISKGPKGPDLWHYLDPVTLARRQGQAVAAALAGKLRLPREQVFVSVVPRPVPSGGQDVPGYDATGEQIRILAGAIEWTEPKPIKSTKPQEKDDRAPRKRRRRILERPPENVSWNHGHAKPSGPAKSTA